MQSGEHFERFAIEGCLGQRFNQTLNHSRISGRVDDPKAFTASPVVGLKPYRIARSLGEASVEFWR